MIEFEFKVDASFGKDKKVRIGILKDQKLWSWKKEHKRMGSLTVNKQVKKQWGDDTVGSSLASVLENTTILSEFKKVMDKRGKELLIRLLQNEKEDKVLNNSFAALLKQAYIQMSNSKKNSKKRAEQKGFNQFAIGTGQTINSIKAEVYE